MTVSRGGGGCKGGGVTWVELGSKRAGPCHRPWLCFGSLGLKKPSGYWLCEVNDIRHTSRGGIGGQEWQISSFLSVLHERVDAASVDTWLTGVSLPYCRGVGIIATKFSDDRVLNDALGVNGMGLEGDWKGVRLGPSTWGGGGGWPSLPVPCMASAGKGLAFRSGAGVKRGGVGKANFIIRLGRGVGVWDCMSATSGGPQSSLTGQGERSVPASGWWVLMGVCGWLGGGRGHMHGTCVAQSLICPDSTYLVDGVLVGAEMEANPVRPNPVRPRTTCGHSGTSIGPPRCAWSRGPMAAYPLPHRYPRNRTGRLPGGQGSKTRPVVGTGFKSTPRDRVRPSGPPQTAPELPLGISLMSPDWHALCHIT